MRRAPARVARRDATSWRIRSRYNAAVQPSGPFVLRVVTWGVFPLLSVAAAQYPDLASSIFRVIEPFTRALR